jgi:hypothetical protein
MSAAAQAAAPVVQNARASAAANILGKALKAAPEAARSLATGTATRVASSFTAERGSYWLSVLFYLFIYIFAIFLLAVFVHYTITPVFVFRPGAKGLLTVPGTQGDIVTWNTKSQPTASDVATIPNSASSILTKNYSFSIDVYVRGLVQQDAQKRVILLKANKPTTGQAPFTTGPTATQDLASYITSNASLALYLTDTNDLVCTIVSTVDGTPTSYSTAPLKNIPLNTPFRISVVVEERTFSLFLNGKQAFQRTLPAAITLPSAQPTDQSQAFYPPPGWSNSPQKSIYVQNLHIWPQPISAYAVAHANPSLARKEDFDLPADPTGRCSTA